jgi:CRISPR/Cas system CSM-associated protein Csm4 (group 5 of RAMP superfamily)
MTHDKIQLMIQEIRKLEEKLRDIKKDIKKEEKIDDEQYLEMKSGLRDMRLQVKDFEGDYLEDLKKSDFYNQLREMQLKAEEELAHAREKLFDQLEKLPLKPFEMDMNEEEGMVKIQALPELRIFVNGKEVKKG